MHKNAQKQFNELKDWRKNLYEDLYNLILESNPDFSQDWKWSTLVFTLNGKNKIALGVFKDKLKLNFFQGFELNDVDKLFNNGLESKVFRSIDISESDKINKAKLTKLIKQIK